MRVACVWNFILKILSKQLNNNNKLQTITLQLYASTNQSSCPLHPFVLIQTILYVKVDVSVVLANFLSVLQLAIPSLLDWIKWAGRHGLLTSL